MLQPLVPDSLVAREQLALCYFAYANSMREMRRFGEALSYFKKCTEVRESMESSKRPGVTQRLAESVMAEGLVLWQQAQNKAAEERFRRTEDLLLRLESGATRPEREL